MALPADRTSELPRRGGERIVDVTVVDGLPALVDCEITFPRPRVADVSATVGRALSGLPAIRGLEQGQRVAVTAGSRGIANIVQILQAACEYLRGLGLEPVVVSSMGSHGGGTADGQRRLLSSLGISEVALGGVPVHCGTDTEVVARTAGQLPVHIDRYVSSEVHGILVVNRVKAHTAFRGPTESGLLKMIAVGLGKQPGAKVVHRHGPAEMCAAIRAIAAAALDRLPFIGGLAIIENAYEETAEIVPLMPQEFLSREEGLLSRANELMPVLPAGRADILVVERFGKEISGTGMDTNIIGRRQPYGAAAAGTSSEDIRPDRPDGPVFRRVVALELTPASGGNATGIGLADFTTDKAVGAVDRRATYTNCLTSTLIDRARLPLFLPDDRQAIAAAVLSLGDVDPGQVTLVQIADTKRLDRIRVSANLVRLLKPQRGAVLDVSKSAPAQLAFDRTGTLARID